MRYSWRPAIARKAGSLRAVARCGVSSRAYKCRLGICEFLAFSARPRGGCCGSSLVLSGGPPPGSPVASSRPRVSGPSVFRGVALRLGPWPRPRCRSGPRCLGRVAPSRFVAWVPPPLRGVLAGSVRPLRGRLRSLRPPGPGSPAPVCGLAAPAGRRALRPSGRPPLRGRPSAFLPSRPCGASGRRCPPWGVSAGRVPSGFRPAVAACRRPPAFFLGRLAACGPRSCPLLGRRVAWPGAGFSAARLFSKRRALMLSPCGCRVQRSPFRSGLNKT